MRDYYKEIRRYRKVANQGDADAQYQLGMCYWDEYQRTVAYYKTQYQMGMFYYDESYEWDECYDQSISTILDNEAVQWFHKAAEQGHANAQFRLGMCYLLGRGVPQNRDNVIYWFRKAVAQGHAEAKDQLKQLGIDN